MSILSNLLFYLVGMCLQKLIFISSIANLVYRTPSWQCRRGDASPPGELASPPGEDAFMTLGRAARK